MTYTDEDIIDLYEDLQSVGLAETPEERSARLLREAVKAGELLSKGMTMDQASAVLTDKGISHTFYTMLWKSCIGEENITNFILVGGLTVFFERGLAGPTRDNLPPEGFLKLLRDFAFDFVSGDYYTCLKELPKSGPRGVRINSPIRHTHTHTP